MQLFDLPVVFFDETLLGIRVTDERSSGIHSGLVSGVTMSTIPIPIPAAAAAAAAAAWLVGSALLGLGALKRKKA
jgi:hypothetical protein